jgi:hypothetical protein
MSHTTGNWASTMFITSPMISVGFWLEDRGNHHVRIKHEVERAYRPEDRRARDALMIWSIRREEREPVPLHSDSSPISRRTPGSGAATRPRHPPVGEHCPFISVNRGEPSNGCPWRTLLMVPIASVGVALRKIRRWRSHRSIRLNRPRNCPPMSKLS